MNELSLLDTLFNDGCSLAVPSFASTAFNMPSVDVKQTKDAYIFEMDLPGLTENDIDISLKDNKLTVCSVQEKAEGEKKAEPKEEKTAKTEEEQEVFLIHERRASQFRRSFSLPRDIDIEGTGACFKNGVLVITVPRKPEAAPRKITIQVA